jgi:hypothetical protein
VKVFKNIYILLKFVGKLLVFKVRFYASPNIVPVKIIKSHPMKTTNVYARLVSDNTRHTYSIEWLDLLITVFLNPSRTDIASITDEQLERLSQLIVEEDAKLQITIRSQVFNLSNETKIELLIRQYHSTLINLVDKSLENEKLSVHKNKILKELFKFLHKCLDDIISFVEVNYGQYLVMQEKVPARYIALSKKELKIRISKLKLKIPDFECLQPLVSIILEGLNNHTDSHVLRYEVTYSTIVYKKDLVKKLEKIDWGESAMEICAKINEALIYLNYNSKSYINYFTSTIKSELKECENDLERMDRLLFCYKAFNQMHRKPGFILNPNYHNLSFVISNWFLQEIVYMEKKLHLSTIPSGDEKEKNQKKELNKRVLKVMCALSTDQIGLILRAADELRVIIAKSMNEVFRTIVPHLSTPYRTDLSFEGMRTQSYVAEESDKQKAIETLERLIKKIKEY